MPRSCSHVMSFGTMSSAVVTPGFEMIPTVLMTGIQQKLLIPFGAENRALHHDGLEPVFADGRGDAFANGLVNPGIAHDSALAHLALPGLELRFDQYNHLPIGMEQGDGGGQNEGNGNEADVADDERSEEHMSEL